jgi:DNA-binding NarL/FixJ family response regulator
MTEKRVNGIWTPTAAGLRCQFDSPPELTAVVLGPDVRREVLLAAQEAVNNAVHHVQARQVTMRLQVTAGQCVLDITDDGKGFDKAATQACPGAAERGFGLASLHERLASLGGRGGAGRGKSRLRRPEPLPSLGAWESAPEMLPAARSIRVMAVEDARRTREALVALLGGSPGFACAGACATAEDALQQMVSKRPDVVLVDLELPGLSGTEFLRECRRRCPAMELVVLTVHDVAEWVFPALAAGASGYVVKGTAPARLLEAIEEVHRGGSFMSGSVARLVLESFRTDGSPATADGGLSAREQEVLALLAKGLRSADIAEQLRISPRTVSTHLYHIYEKLHVHSAAGAVGRFLGHGSATSPRPPR